MTETPMPEHAAPVMPSTKSSPNPTLAAITSIVLASVLLAVSIPVLLRLRSYEFKPPVPSETSPRERSQAIANELNQWQSQVSAYRSATLFSKQSTQDASE